MHLPRPCTAYAILIAVAFAVLLFLCIIHSIAFFDNGRKQLPLFADHLSPRSTSPQWLSVPNRLNFTSTLLSRWRRPPAPRRCQNFRTASIFISGLDDAANSPVELPAGAIHEFEIKTFGKSNSPRCSGGDYFETDLSGSSWKSRPPVVDHNNGSYTVRVQVDAAFVGVYNFTVVLVYHGFDGLLGLEKGKYTHRRKVTNKSELRKIMITFYDDGSSLPEIKQCKNKDWKRDVWSGRWTRPSKNDTCEVDDFGRYRCLDPNVQCPSPWCDGPLAALESNGWVYSAHCSFGIFTQDSAWQCLASKWLFFWGDSNHVDTIRNLLNFVLGLPEITQIARRIDDKFANPKNGSESVRITSIFNGHWNESMNHLGLQSLKNENFRKLIRKYFSEDTFPDVMILNSGLHDGIYWENIQKFAEGAEYAAEFWSEIMRHMKTRAAALPRVFYRSTVATAGPAREELYNPSKMEAFNGVLLEKLREKGVITGGVIDHFDMTFPWHYDSRCSDGVHYGRPPEKKQWKDGQIGHHYFVDLMLGHVLLNAICNG